MPYRTPSEYIQHYEEIKGRERAIESVENPFKHDEQYNRRIIASGFVNEWILKNKKLGDTVRILDIGSGTDLFTYQWIIKLNGRPGYNIDYQGLDCVDNSDILDKAKFKSFQLTVGDWRELDKYYKQKFDIIIWLDGPEHETKPLKVYRQMNELLKDDGRIVLSVPLNCPAWGHARILTADSFKHEASRIFELQNYILMDDFVLPEAIAICKKGDLDDIL